MRTVYYLEIGNTNWGYSSKEECEKYEAKERERVDRWIENMRQNSSAAKLEQLKLDLEKANTIWPGTLATCSYESLAIKGMVQVCQKFIEENKEYLKSY